MILGMRVEFLGSLNGRLWPIAVPRRTSIERPVSTRKQTVE